MLLWAVIYIKIKLVRDSLSIANYATSEFLLYLNYSVQFSNMLQHPVPGKAQVLKLCVVETFMFTEMYKSIITM